MVIYLTFEFWRINFVSILSLMSNRGDNDQNTHFIDKAGRKS